jgi:hypothetical protein
MSAKPILKSILTRQIISQLKPGDETSDAACPGLRVRCTDTAKVFFYRYRLASGELRQIKLGEFGAMTLPAARNELARRRLEREQGIDPQEEKRKVRERAKSERAARGQGVYTVDQLVADYVKEALCAQKRGGESERVLREVVEKLGEQPAVGITRRILLNEVIRPAMLRAPRVATQLLSRIRCAYQHASDQGRLPDEFLSPTLSHASWISCGACGELEERGRAGFLSCAWTKVQYRARRRVAILPPNLPEARHEIASRVERSTSRTESWWSSPNRPEGWNLSLTLAIPLTEAKP